MKRKLKCEPGCGHTSDEHRAFDTGVDDGERGKGIDDCPYDDDDMREAWMFGQSVGALNRGKHV